MITTLLIQINSLLVLEPKPWKPLLHPCLLPLSIGPPRTVIFSSPPDKMSVSSLHFPQISWSTQLLHGKYLLLWMPVCLTTSGQTFLAPTTVLVEKLVLNLMETVPRILVCVCVISITEDCGVIIPVWPLCGSFSLWSVVPFCLLLPSEFLWLFTSGIVNERVTKGSRRSAPYSSLFFQNDLGKGIIKKIFFASSDLIWPTWGGSTFVVLSLLFDFLFSLLFPSTGWFWFAHKNLFFLIFLFPPEKILGF